MSSQPPTGFLGEFIPKLTARFIRFPSMRMLYAFLFILAILLSLIAAAAPAGHLMNWFSVDDGFYYFKVARNIVEGHGSTFDGINLTNGYHPLWMGLCIPVFWLARFNLMLPLRIIILIAGLLNAGSAILLFRVLSRQLNIKVAFAAAAFWAVFPAVQRITTTQGMETGLSVFLLLLLIDTAQTWFGDAAPRPWRRLLLFGLVAALAVLARLDNIFYVGLICLFVLFRIKILRLIFIFDWIAICVSAYLSWIILLRFGTTEVLDHSVFPLLLLGLGVKPLVLYFVRQYAPYKMKGMLDFIKLGGWVLLMNMVFVAVLYGVNALDLSIRFSKLLIILDAVFSSALIMLNHTCHALRYSAEPAQVPQKSQFSIYQQLGSKLKTVFFMGAPLLLLVSAYLYLNFRVFSTIMPVSGRVKHFWSTLPNSIYGKARTFLDVFGLGGRVNPWKEVTDALSSFVNKSLSAIGIFGEVTSRVVFFVLLGLLVAGLIILFKVGKFNALRKLNGLYFPALFLGSLGRITYYSVSGYVAIRNWYWIIEKLLMLILLAFILEWLVRQVGSGQTCRKLVNISLVALTILLFINNISFGLRMTPWSIPDGQQQEYLVPARDLEANTPPGALIGMTGSGAKGYFVQGRTIVNLDGLINSYGYYQSLVTGTTADFLREMGLDYVYGDPYVLLETGPYDQIFTGRVEVVKQLTNRENYTLYRFIP